MKKQTWTQMDYAGSLVCVSKQQASQYHQTWKRQGLKARLFERDVRADRQRHTVWVVVARRPKATQ